MEKIKFRGRTVLNNKIICGDLLHYEDDRVGICPIGKAESDEVIPESVVPFVGYDADGNEVYEGDKFTDKFGHTFTARLLPQAICKNGDIRIDWLPKSCDFHLFPDDFDVEEDFVNADKNNL